MNFSLKAVAVLAVGSMLLACMTTTDESDEEAVASDSQELFGSRCRRRGAACDDGNPCTYNDRCDSSRRCVGTAYTCDDGNVCTTDTCDGRGSCNFRPNTDRCDDGNACTTGDVCSNGQCVGGSGTVSCNDNNPCTTDSCDPAGGCTHVPNNNACDDNDACTTGDHCADGMCTATLDPTCSSNGECNDPNDPNTCINCMAWECPMGYVCAPNARCISHCGDGRQNGDEGGVDCGGSCDPKCPSGSTCWTSWDCASGRCSSGRCL